MDSDVNHPKRGRRVQFVRWLNSDDGWYSEIRAGRLLGTTPEAWVVEIDGRPERLARVDWARFLSEPKVAASSSRDLSRTTRAVH